MGSTKIMFGKRKSLKFIHLQNVRVKIYVLDEDFCEKFLMGFCKKKYLDFVLFFRRN